MARITVEDCLQKIKNHFQLVRIASHRARLLHTGSEARIESSDKHKTTVVSLREIAEGKVDESVLNEPLIEPTLAGSGKSLAGLLANDINMRPGAVAVPGMEVGNLRANFNEGIAEGAANEVMLPEGTEGAESASSDDDNEDVPNRMFGNNTNETDISEDKTTSKDAAYNPRIVSLESLQSEEEAQQPETDSDEINAQTAEAMENMADLNLDTISQAADEEKNA